MALTNIQKNKPNEVASKDKNTRIIVLYYDSIDSEI